MLPRSLSRKVYQLNSHKTYLREDALIEITLKGIDAQKRVTKQYSNIKIESGSCCFNFFSLENIFLLH